MFLIRPWCGESEYVHSPQNKLIMKQPKETLSVSLKCKPLARHPQRTHIIVSTCGTDETPSQIYLESQFGLTPKVSRYMQGFGIWLSVCKIEKPLINNSALLQAYLAFGLVSKLPSSARVSVN